MKKGFRILKFKKDKPVFEVRNISKAYDGRPILKQLSMKVFPGECVGVLGPNGCGKTTLFSMCIGEQNNVTEYGSLVVGNNNYVKDSYMIFDNNFGDNKGKEKSMYIGGDYHFRMQDIEEDCMEKLKKLKMKGDYVNMSKLMMLMLGAMQEMIKT